MAAATATRMAIPTTTATSMKAASDVGRRPTLGATDRRRLTTRDALWTTCAPWVPTTSVARLLAALYVDGGLSDWAVLSAREKAVWRAYARHVAALRGWGDDTQ